MTSTYKFPHKVSFSKGNELDIINHAMCDELFIYTPRIVFTHLAACFFRNEYMVGMIWVNNETLYFYIKYISTQERSPVCNIWLRYKTNCSFSLIARKNTQKYEFSDKETLHCVRRVRMKYV